MSESGPTTESHSTPPEPPPSPPPPEQPAPPEPGSIRSQSYKLGGGGIGSLLIWGVGAYNIQDPAKTFLIGAAPFAAVYVASYAPRARDGLAWIWGLAKLLFLKVMIGWVLKGEHANPDRQKALREISSALADYLMSTFRRKRK